MGKNNYQVFSKSNNFFKLSPKFKISLAKIEAINPFIPKIGTKKKIKLMLTNRSIILMKRTLTWASSPFKILSTTMSTYIKGIRGANIFI